MERVDRRVKAPTLPLSRRARARARVSDGNQRPWPADKVERWSIDRLIPYAKNARTHSDAQIAAIARQTGAPRCRRLGGDVPPAGHCPRPVAGLDRNQRTGAQDAELCPKRAAGEVSRLGPVCRSARHSTHRAGGSGISVISTCIGAGREAHRTTPAPAARASTRPGRTTSPSTSPLRGTPRAPSLGIYRKSRNFAVWNASKLVRIRTSFCRSEPAAPPGGRPRMADLLGCRLARGGATPPKPQLLRLLGWQNRKDLRDVALEILGEAFEERLPVALDLVLAFRPAAPAADAGNRHHSRRQETGHTPPGGEPEFRVR